MIISVLRYFFMVAAAGAVGGLPNNTDIRRRLLLPRGRHVLNAIGLPGESPAPAFLMRTK
jgi:hypothetical protein